MCNTYDLAFINTILVRGTKPWAKASVGIAPNFTIE